MRPAIAAPLDTWIHPEGGTGSAASPAGGVLATRDVVIVGSGYGASVAAYRLSDLRSPDGRDLSVLVLERGREHAVGTFPNDLGELPGHVRRSSASDPRPIGNPDALVEIRSGEDVDVVVGNGLGGGSLINANVAEEPRDEVFASGWPAGFDADAVRGHFGRLHELLGTQRAGPPGDEAAAPDPKSRAFDGLVRALAADDALGDHTVRRAPITVAPRTEGGPWSNGVGIAQRACTGCGNCVTGCNVGAKNTLATNLIPLACERGAEFVTGANVLRVRAAREESAGDGARWEVVIQRTSSLRTPLEHETFTVRARHVILAAGTLGSTEILMRSSDTGDLAFSEKLGQGFSTNGDALAFTFGERERVDAIGSRDLKTGPGPTITTSLQGRNADGVAYTIQDGAIPAALERIYGNAIITAAQLARLGSVSLPARLASAPLDPLAHHADTLRHGQVLLVMSDDGANRALEMAPAVSGRTAVFPRKLEPCKRDVAHRGLAWIDRLLLEHDLGQAVQGGQYVANPLWRLLSPDASGVVHGGLPEPRDLTVHPLGGCPMADDVSGGVVDPDGRVFAADGGRHEGLHVMDGAIVPRALGTNPFLTISALAWQCCETLRDTLAGEGWQPRPDAPESVSEPGRWPVDPVHEPGADAGPPRAPQLIVREQLVGSLRGGAVRRLRAILPEADRLFAHQGLVLRLTTDPFDVYSKFAWRPDDPGAEAAPVRDENGVAHDVVLTGEAELFLNPETASQAFQRQRYGAPPALSAEHRIARGRMRVRLLGLDVPGPLTELWRATLALAAFVRRRGLSAALGSRRKRSEKPWSKQLLGFLGMARAQTRYRQFDYRFELEGEDGLRIEFEGVKPLGWAPGKPRVWDALLQLPVERMRISRGRRRVTCGAALEVDARRMLDEGMIQVADSDDMVESAVAVASFAGWLARSILDTHVWDFGAPPYERSDAEDAVPPRAAGDARAPQPPRLVDRVPAPHPITVDGRRLAPEGPIELEVPVDDRHEHEKLRIELHRYAAEGGEPVLLIHGLGQGSGIFTSDRLSHNMARYFRERGYDVWVLDYRLSNRFSRQAMQYEAWSIDEIGRHDVPAAIHAVFEQTGRPVKVFAHCVGAIATEMAILEGRIERHDGASKLESVCLNAIHPWIVPAAANRVRTQAGALARTWITSELLDPIPHEGAAVEATETLFDRLASSLARYQEGTKAGGDGHGPTKRVSDAICDRMTLLYGRLWRHENIEDSLHDHWDEIVGPSPVEVYQQLYSMLARGRVLDSEAANVFLTRDRIEQHWTGIATLFLHGDESDAFNPHSATRSAVRLSDVIGRERVRQLRIARYGHTDPILGARAHRDAYPGIEHFFRVFGPDSETEDPRRFTPYEPASDLDAGADHELESGQILRAAWQQDGRLHVRSWMERNAYATRPPEGVAVRGSGVGYHVAESDLIHPGGPPVAGSPWHEDGAFALLDEMLTPDQDYRPRRVTSRLDESGDWTIEENRHATGSAGARAASLPFFDRLRRKLGTPVEDRGALRFLVGSCRYPGTPFEADQADAIFAPMAEIAQESEADLAFLLGDQIYADAYNDVFEPDLWRERYFGGYQRAFASPNFRRLASTLPIHFAIDDHEIVNDWSGGATASDRRRRRAGPVAERGPGALSPAQLQFALRAARLHVGSGRHERPIGGAPRPPRKALWYALAYGAEVDFPCFVLDTRSERKLRTIANAATAPMLGDTQLEAFLDWLRESQQVAGTRPKFVFAGQVIAPVRRALLEHPETFRSDDSFLGYPATLRRVIECIATEGIRNVVFVGGDQHRSSVSRLQFEVDRDGRRHVAHAWQIVSSGLYAPMRFANPHRDAFLWDQWQEPVLLAGGDVRLRAWSSPLASGLSHFARVDVERLPRDELQPSPLWLLKVAAFDVDSRVLGEGTFDWRQDDLRVVFA